MMLRNSLGCLVSEIVVSYSGVTFKEHVWLRLLLRSFATWKAEVGKVFGHLCLSSVSVNYLQSPCFRFAFSGQFVSPSVWSGPMGPVFFLAGHLWLVVLVSGPFFFRSAILALWPASNLPLRDLSQVFQVLTTHCGFHSASACFSISVLHFILHQRASSHRASASGLVLDCSSVVEVNRVSVQVGVTNQTSVLGVYKSTAVCTIRGHNLHLGKWRGPAKSEQHPADARANLSCSRRVLC